MFHRVSTECILSSDTLISHECAHIRDRPTLSLKDAERFRTGSMIHEIQIYLRVQKKQIYLRVPTKNLAKSLTQNVIRNVI